MISYHCQLQSLFDSLYIKHERKQQGSLRFSDPLWGNPPVTNGITTQKANNAKNIHAIPGIHGCVCVINIMERNIMHSSDNT